MSNLNEDLEAAQAAADTVSELCALEGPLETNDPKAKAFIKAAAMVALAYSGIAEIIGQHMGLSDDC